MKSPEKVGHAERTEQKDAGGEQYPKRVRRMLKTYPHCRSEPDWRNRVRLSQWERLGEELFSFELRWQSGPFSYLEKVRMRGFQQPARRVQTAPR